MTKTESIKLLKLAYRIIDGIPKERIDLGLLLKNDKHPDQVCNPHDCGTLGCAIGWLSLHPEMKKHGLGSVVHYSWSSEVAITYKKTPMSYDVAAAKVFGITETQANILFRPPRGRDYGSDKKVWKRRCKELIEELEWEVHIRGD